MLRRSARRAILQLSTSARRLRARSALVYLGLIVLVDSCEPVRRGTQVIWSSAPATREPGTETTKSIPDSLLRAPSQPGSRAGNLVNLGETFLLPVTTGQGEAAEIRMLRFDRRSRGEPRDDGVRFRGGACGLVRLPDERLLLATVEGDPAVGSRLVVRRGSADARTWEDPVVVSGRSGSPVLGSSRPIATRAGEVYMVAGHRWRPKGSCKNHLSDRNIFRRNDICLPVSIKDEVVTDLANSRAANGQGLFDNSMTTNLTIALDLAVAKILLARIADNIMKTTGLNQQLGAYYAAIFLFLRLSWKTLCDFLMKGGEHDGEGSCVRHGC